MDPSQDPFQDILNTPQRHQQQTRQAFRELVQNVEESPRRRSAARPETPTPLPGYVERTRTSRRSQNRSSRTIDLQSSPRRRRPDSHAQNDENAAPLSLTVQLPMPSSISFINYTSCPEQRQSSRATIQCARQMLEQQETLPLMPPLRTPSPHPFNELCFQLTPPTIPMSPNAHVQPTHTVNARSLAQQRRREREREANALQLPTPPATHVPERMPRGHISQDSEAASEQQQQEDYQAEPIHHEQNNEAAYGNEDVA
ncbi:hypothetical protein BDZ97DRAFT_1751453 [Flammula alnicola]|nr:hypothetical protein BDZ97DRAFT_1753672 [Flammula alnicola]KAF8974719.1 hypothetical protein BDZ97DRAFT_1751453 [Flammula alnicola]